MEDILLPSRLEIIPGKHKNEATLEGEPFFHGYGTTIGNSLRRVLLSSLPGAAVTAVKIKGAQHEFTALPNIKEDMLDMILNLKNLRLKIFTDEQVRLSLKIKGEKEVTAADIEAPSSVEIVNPELHIAALTNKKAELEMEIFCGRGRGYVPTEERTDAMEIGTIAVDALYSPVRNVSLKVENVRVGQITNYDKIILQVETDGSITPKEAILQAVKIILNHFNLFMAFGEQEVVKTEPVSAEGPKTEEIKEEAAAPKAAAKQKKEKAAAAGAEAEAKPKKKRAAKKK